MSGTTDMDVLVALSFGSKVILYTILAAITIYTFLVLWAQLGVIRGKPFDNPDGTKDDWREQKVFYGIAWADIFVACPASLVALVTIFVAPRWGFYLMGLVSFWFVWANVMTTVTSLRFARPRITVAWLVVFPSGILVGLSFIAWTLMHFDAVFGM